MYNIAIDLGGTITKIGVIREHRIIAYEEVESHSGNGLAPLLGVIRTTVDRIAKRCGLPPGEVAGAGLAFPGIANHTSKRVVATNAKFDDACELDLERWCRETWGCRFVLDNDSRLATIGEWQYGAGRGADNLVMMTIGTGIGTGVIIKGAPLYGANSMAGSLGGHFVVDYRGRVCTCGNRGCVESMASSFFLPQIIRNHPQLSDGFKQEMAGCDFKALFTRAASSDADARILCNECMDIWAAAIITYIHAYDPQRVILSGGIMNSRETILPYLQRIVNKHAWCPVQKVEIVSSQLNDQAALMGIDYCLCHPQLTTDKKPYE